MKGGKIEKETGGEYIDETQRLIIEIVNKITNEKYLNFLYDLLNSFKKKWGI